MTFAGLIRRFGDSNSAIAKGLNTSRQLVAHWRKNGISAQRQAWIREQLKAK